jgi:uncharacterized protein (UPF0297 family)
MSDKNLSETMLFDPQEEEEKNIRDIMTKVYDALQEKGYKPENQLVGYLMSGDPTYITSYKDARKMIRQIDRDTIIEELIKFYIND